MERIEEPFYLDTARIAPSARIGVSFYPRDGSSPERLLRAAVHSMYLEKRGRGQLALVPPLDPEDPE
jgi:GGDEF domain-containing protein